MNSRVVLISFLCVAMGAALAADDAAELHKKGIAALKESQSKPETLVSAARYFAKASAAFEASGKNELAVDANSFLYYCKKKMTMADIDAFLKGEDAVVSARLNKIESKPIGAFEAQASLDRAEAFAKSNPGEQFLITVRYFEVAERFKDSDVGRTAMSRSLEAMQKYIASQKPPAANVAAPAESPKTATPPAETPKTAAPVESPKPAVALKPGRTINLLQLIDPLKDGMSGKWLFKDGQLVGQKNGSHARLQIRYKPPAEYDFRIVFSRTEGKNMVGQIASKGDRFFCTYMDGFEMFVGLELIDSKPAHENETSVRGPFLINKQWQTAVIQVRNTGVNVMLDGKLVTKFNQYDRMSLHPGWKLGPEAGLGLIMDRTTSAQFGVVELIEMIGQGEKPR